jgi:hypothetical protein
MRKMAVLESLFEVKGVALMIVGSQWLVNDYKENYNRFFYFVNMVFENGCNSMEDDSILESQEFFYRMDPPHRKSSNPGVEV